MLQPPDLLGGPKTTKHSLETKFSPRVIFDHVLFLAVLQCFFKSNSLDHTVFPSTGKVLLMYLFPVTVLVLTALHRQADFLLLLKSVVSRSLFFIHQFQLKPLFVQRRQVSPPVFIRGSNSSLNISSAVPELVQTPDHIRVILLIYNPALTS